MKKQTYEEAVSRLEKIVDLLENGENSLEESLKLYEEGAGLLSFCYSALKNAEQRITELSALEEQAQETGSAVQ